LNSDTISSSWLICWVSELYMFKGSSSSSSTL